MPDRPQLGPTIFVLFGATGDLSKRMVLPAFFQLARSGLLGSRWMLIGTGRGTVTDDHFRAHVRDSLTQFGGGHTDDGWDDFAQRLRFAGGGFTPEDPGTLPSTVQDARDSLGVPDAQLVHYLALPRAPSPTPHELSARTTWRAVPGSSTKSRSVPHNPLSVNSTPQYTRFSTRSRSIASTISSARKAPRICTSCDLPTG